MTSRDFSRLAAIVTLVAIAAIVTVILSHHGNDGDPFADGDARGEATDDALAGDD